jgi:hypothetical protein
VFAKAKVLFSVGGEYYNGRPLVYTYMPDTVLENARNVSINLHGRFGRFVKVQVFFAARWIMISEVVFESGKASLQYIYFFSPLKIGLSCSKRTRVSPFNTIIHKIIF